MDDPAAKYRKAFEQRIYVPYADIVYRVALRKTGNVSLAEDVVQEVFVRAYANVSSVADPARIREWLLRIANNVIADVFRNRAVHSRHEESIRQAVVNRDEAQVEALRELLLREINALPADLRNTLLMYFEQDMSAAEVAVELQIAEGTVRWRLSEGRRALKDKLQTRLEDYPQLEKFAAE